MNTKIFELLDFGIESNIKQGHSYLWEENYRKGNYISIPKLLENDPLSWRNKYLSWTNQIANSKVNGLELYKHFKSKLIHDESFWWQTLIADKCPYKSKSPYYIIKIWIIEKLFYEGEFNVFIYRGENKVLAKILSNWIKENSLGQFYWYKKNKNTALKNIFSQDKIPPIFTAVIPLFRFLIRKLIYFKNISFNENAKITIVTYYPGVDQEKINDGIFYSNYWGPLNDYINNLNIPINWIWVYSKQQFSFKKAVEYQAILNSKSKETGKKYFFLENNLSLFSLLVALTEFFRLGFKSYFIKFKIKSSFKNIDSKINFYPLLENEWKHSFWGGASMNNYIYAASFKNIKIPPTTERILYIWENQPWEQSLLSIRNKFQNTIFFGAVHTPANSSLFNLKVFPGDPSELKIKNGRKMPNFICALSENSRTTLINGGWPSKNIIITEALRYIESLNTEVTKTDNTPKNLLVVTGSILKEVEQQLQILFEFEKNSNNYFDNIIIKPHPIIPIDNFIRKNTTSTNIKITNLSLKELWSNATVVFTANSTSVGLESYYLGLPLIVTGAIENFNLNSLFGTKDVYFINSTNEFTNVLENLKNNYNSKSVENENIFCINNSIPIWKNILNAN